MKVLIVDDNTVFSNKLKTILEDNGIYVDTINNSKKCLKIAKKYDLIFLDIWLPKINGIDVLKKLKRKYQVPIIALTTEPLKIALKKYVSLGFKTCLSKPLNIQEISALLNSYIT